MNVFSSGQYKLLLLVVYTCTLFNKRLVDCAGQVENTGAHGKNIPAAKEGRASAPGALGQGPRCPCLLVPTASQATAQTSVRDFPSPLRTSQRQARSMC